MNMERCRKWLKFFGIGLISLVLIYFLWISLIELWCIFSLGDKDIKSTIIGIFVTAVVSLTGILISKKLDRKNQEQKDLRDLRTPSYEEFISFVFKAMFSVKKGRKPMGVGEINKEMERLTPLLIAQASEKVLLAYERFREEEDDEIERINTILKLVLIMREDLGYTNKGISIETLKNIFIIKESD